jgi:hypothetical protein
MKSHTYNDFQLVNNSSMLEEYRKLIRLPFPSSEELDRIDFILEQAQTDPKLNDALCFEDEELAVELDLSEKNDLDYHKLNFELKSNNEGASVIHFNGHGSSESSLNNLSRSEKSHPTSKELNVTGKVVPLFPGVTQVAKRKGGFRGYDVKHVASFLVGGILIFAVSTCLKNKEPDNTQLQMPQHHSSVMSPELLPVGNKGETQASVCNLDLSSANQKMQEYYISYSELDKQVTSQQLQPLERKMHVKQLQKTAEIRQKQLEEAQRDAEHQKYQAELKKQFDVAQKWKDRASYSLEQSRQWLCLSKSVLHLY